MLLIRLGKTIPYIEGKKKDLCSSKKTKIALELKKKINTVESTYHK